MTTAIVTRSTETTDANASNSHPLKVALGELLTGSSVLVDIHGMGDHSTFDVAVGLGNGGASESADIAADCFRRFGFCVDEDGSGTGFTASHSTTMASWAQTLGADGFQLELARRHRTFRSPAAMRERLLRAMCEMLNELEHRCDVDLTAT